MHIRLVDAGSTVCVLAAPEIGQTVDEKARSLYDKLLRTAADELALTNSDKSAGPDANELGANELSANESAGPGVNEPARDPEEHLREMETRNSLEAIAMYEALLGDQIRTFGSGHSATIATRNSLAKAYADGGEPQKAIDAYKALLADITETFGPDHTNTVTARQSCLRLCCCGRPRKCNRNIRSFACRSGTGRRL